SRETASGVLDRGRLAGFFEAVITGDDVKAGKPDAEIVTRAIAAVSATPSRSLVVEDAEAGLIAADRSGAWSVTVRTEALGAGSRWLGCLPALAALAGQLLRWP